MRIKEQLPTIKEKILEEIRMAAKNADIEAIAKWSKAAENCEKLIQEKSEFESQIWKFANSLWPEQKPPFANQFKNSHNYQNPATKREISSKKEGAMARERWVEVVSSKGIILNGHDKRYYTEDGRSVSIAFANELDKPQLSDKWFLGLKDEPTDISVLICKEKNGELFDFILPIMQMESIWESLSRSGGQVKFHIHRKREEFLLSFPGREPMVINNYISNYQPLNIIHA